MADAHKNFASSLVATAPSPASSGTSLVVTAADGAKFPAVPFNATIWPASAQPTTANAEIVRVTAISTDTFTITRTQESSSARTVVIGDQIAATITSKTLTDVELSVYVTTADQTVPATTEVTFESYLELSASFFYELSTDAILVIGDFATPLPLPDQNPNIFITVNDELVPSNSEVVFSDFYELSAPFTAELASGAVIQLGTSASPTTGLLAISQYGPPALVTYAVTNSAGLTVLDAANLSVRFVVPASGSVLVRFSASMKLPTGGGDIGFGLLNHTGGSQIGSTLSNVMALNLATAGPVARFCCEWYLTGLSAGSNLGLDVAAGVSTAITANVFAMSATGAVSDSNVGPALIVVQEAFQMPTGGLHI